METYAFLGEKICRVNFRELDAKRKLMRRFLSQARESLFTGRLIFSALDGRVVGFASGLS